MSLNRKANPEQGIFDLQRGELLVKIPTKREIAQYEPGQEIIDGAIVYVDKRNRSHPSSLLIGVTGFGPKGTALTSRYIFQEEGLNFIERELHKIDDAKTEPLFFVTQVDYYRGGLGERVEFIAAQKAIT